MSLASRAYPAGEPGEASYLQPGALWAGSGDEACRTILGSCVAVCLWDPERAVGAMNHYQLPLVAGGARSTPLRFAEPALAGLYEAVLAAGARAGSLRARIYGGAHVLKVLTGNLDLGQRNVAQAEAFLAARRIPVVERRTGGEVGLRLVFRAGDGATWVRPVRSGGR